VSGVIEKNPGSDRRLAANASARASYAILTAAPPDLQLTVKSLDKQT